MSYAQLLLRRSLAGDFHVSWLAAQALLAGENPYLVIRPVGEYPFNAPFYYPLLAGLAAVPFSWLTPALAGAVFFGLSSALLAYAVLDREPFRLPLFLSTPFIVAAALAQWSPLMMAAAVLPGLAWLLACKPNLGMSLLAARPSWGRLAAVAGFGLLSLAVQPDWLFHWREVFSSPSFHLPPLFILPFGPLLLLAALRWRDPGARLLLAMALLPQSMWFSDQLVLWMIPHGKAQVWLMTGLSWLAYGLWRLVTGGAPPVTGAEHPGQYILWLMYLPALVLVLLPEERTAARLKRTGSAIRAVLTSWFTHL